VTRDTACLKTIFYGLAKAGQIERVPGKVGNKAAWQRAVNGK